MSDYNTCRLEIHLKFYKSFVLLLLGLFCHTEQNQIKYSNINCLSKYLEDFKQHSGYFNVNIYVVFSIVYRKI